MTRQSITNRDREIWLDESANLGRSGNGRLQRGGADQYVEQQPEQIREAARLERARRVEHAVDRVGHQQAAQPCRQKRVRRATKRHHSDEAYRDRHERDVHDGIAHGDQATGELHRAIGDVRVDHQHAKHSEGAACGDRRVQQRRPVAPG